MWQATIQKRFLFLNYLHGLQDHLPPSGLDSSVNFSIRPSLSTLFLKCVHVLTLQHFLNFLLSLSSSIHQHLIYYVIYKHICLWYVSLPIRIQNPCCHFVQLFCLTVCNPMDYSMPGSSVLHRLPEFAQIHAHWLVMLSNHLILSFPCSFLNLHV